MNHPLYRERMIRYGFMQPSAVRLRKGAWLSLHSGYELLGNRGGYKRAESIDRRAIYAVLPATNAIAIRNFRTSAISPCPDWCMHVSHLESMASVTTECLTVLLKIGQAARAMHVDDTKPHCKQPQLQCHLLHVNIESICVFVTAIGKQNRVYICLLLKLWSTGVWLLAHDIRC